MPRGKPGTGRPRRAVTLPPQPTAQQAPPQLSGRPVEPRSTYAPPLIGETVLYKIHGFDDGVRPATVVRVDSEIDCSATLFVMTLPGDQPAAAARVQMRVAVRSKRGDSIGEWQPRA